MKRFKWLALGVAGVILPVVLVFSAYLIASGSIGAANAVPPVPQNRVSDDSTPSPTASPSDRSGKGGVSDDRGGRCSEPEHMNDDSCKSGSDSSGSGSGRGGGDDSPNSGSGSDSSGSGGDD
jgi:hypothetical protein